MDCYFSSRIASKWSGIIWITNNSHKYHRAFVLENCYSLQLLFYHASLWRESCTWNEVTFYIVSFPIFCYGNRFSKKWCPGAKRDFLLLWGSDVTKLANIFAWFAWRGTVVVVAVLLKVLMKENYVIFTIWSFDFHKIFLNIKPGKL